MLTTEQIQKTVADYFKDKPVKKVYLFGSYARGEANEESDVDLLVDLDYTQRIGLNFYGWYIDLEDKFLKKVDIVPDDCLYDSLRPTVDKDKILLAEIKNLAA